MLKLNIQQFGGRGAKSSIFNAKNIRKNKIRFAIENNNYNYLPDNITDNELKSVKNAMKLNQEAKDIGMTLEEVMNNSKAGGVTPQDYIDMVKYQRNRMKQNKAQREITSGTYKRAQNKLQKDINNWFGIGRR